MLVMVALTSMPHGPVRKLLQYVLVLQLFID
jgi:hypothetical protein